MFAGLVRLFFLVFYFAFGMLLLWIFGTEHNALVFRAALAVSAACTLATLGLLYHLFKSYILDLP